MQAGDKNLVNADEAKTHFERLLKRVEHGKTIVIARAGRPIAYLVAYDAGQPPRRGGQWKGVVRMAEDFDAPLPPRIAKSFGGGTS